MKNFLKEFIKRELDTSFLLMLSNPNNQILKLEFKLVYSMYHSNFNEILAARLKPPPPSLQSSTQSPVNLQGGRGDKDAVEQRIIGKYN